MTAPPAEAIKPPARSQESVIHGAAAGQDSSPEGETHRLDGGQLTASRTGKFTVQPVLSAFLLNLTQESVVLPIEPEQDFPSSQPEASSLDTPHRLASATGVVE